MTTTTMRRGSTFGAGILGGVAGMAIGTVLGALLVLAFAAPQLSIKQPGSQSVPLTPAVDTTELLHQHVLRENSVQPAVPAGPQTFEQLHQHLLRENGVGPAAAPAPDGYADYGRRQTTP